MRDIARIILITLLVFAGVFFFVQPYYIYSAGMAPEINNGDVVLLKKRPRNYDVNDVVIYENGVELVGEIIAMPGDIIKVEDNKLFVNEQFIANYSYDNTEYVLEDEYLVINNENFGYIINAKQIKGEIK